MFIDAKYKGLRRVEDIKNELVLYGLFDEMPKKKHILCASQMELLRYNFFYNKNHYYSETSLHSLMVIILRIIRDINIPLEIDFEILFKSFQNSEKKFLPLKSTYYNGLSLEGDIVSDAQDEYLKKIEELSSRKVLIEKTWESHIGTLNYWNKKFITHA